MRSIALLVPWQAVNSEILVSPVLILAAGLSEFSSTGRWDADRGQRPTPNRQALVPSDAPMLRISTSSRSIASKSTNKGNANCDAGTPSHREGQPH